MEFERAIFRVYEKSIESLLHDEPAPNDRGRDGPLNKSCRFFEVFLAFSAFSFFLCLASLHYSFVGNAGCLPSSLMLYNTTSNTTYLYQVRKDDVLGINIRGGKMKNWGTTTTNNDDDDYMTNQWGTGKMDLPLFKHTVAHTIVRSVLNIQEQISLSYSSILSSYIPMHRLLAEKFRHWSSKQRQRRRVLSDNLDWQPFNTADANSSTSSRNSTSNTTASSNTIDHLLDFDYVIAFDEAIFLLDNDVLQRHRFRIINVTLPADTCFGNPSLQTLLTIFNLYDLAMVNNVMFTTKLPGYLMSNEGAIYHWTKAHLQPYQNFGQWVSQKLSILFNSGFAFFLLSTTTTLLVRVLITSGVILIFPTFWCLQCFGVSGLNLRIVSFSYPWIGYPLQAIRAAGQSPYPFIVAHLSRMIVYYLLYVAAQAVYISWLYNDVSFGTDQLWLYVVMMLWEYYTMIYLRSATSIEFFPRMSLALFVLYHIYYYSFPSGFHLMALTVMAFLIMALMTHCIRVYEVKAYRQGLVSFEQPRMLYTNMPWPTWRYDIAPDYSMFMPLNMRNSSVYQDNVPALNTNADNTTPATTAGGNIPQPRARGAQTGRQQQQQMRPGPDPTVGPFASVSGTIEMSSLLRRRNNSATSNDTANNHQQNASSGVGSSQSNSSTNTNNSTSTPTNVVNTLISQFFPPSQMADYQSLANTSIHDQALEPATTAVSALHSQPSSSSSNHSSPTEEV